MVIHDKKIIFIHIPKTAGQSVTEFLLNNINEKFYLKNKKYALINNLKGKIPGPEHYHHCNINEYKELNLVENLDLYFKFTVFRNPYERFISAFYYNVRKHKCNNYIDFIKKIDSIEDKTSSDLFRHFVPQTWYVEYNLSNLNCYFFQENLFPLESYFEKKFNFCKKISYINKTTVIEKQKLNRYTIDFINDYYKDDFEILGYKYETP